MGPNYCLYQRLYNFIFYDIKDFIYSQNNYQKKNYVNPFEILTFLLKNEL